MTIVFVCTGNICRSPMAEAIARTLDIRGVDYVSVGTSALIGLPATRPARRMAEEVGADLSSHRSQDLNALRGVDPHAIYVMEPHQIDWVTSWRPDWSDRIELLDPDGTPIADPYMRSRAAYRKARDQILAAVELRAGEWRAATG